MTQLYDSEVEKFVLRFFIASPFYLNIPKLDDSYFYVPEHKNMFKLMQSYFKQYNRFLSSDVFDVYIAQYDVRDKERAELILLYQEIQIIDINESQFEFFLNRLAELKTGRDIKDIHDSLKLNLSKDQSNFNEILSDLTKRVIQLSSNKHNSSINRGFLWEDVKERWGDYEFKEKHPNSIPGMSYGIRELDEETGGLHKTHTVLFYGRTGSGKTRILSNISLNLAHAGYTVLFIPLEMSRLMLSKCFDSREAILDFALLDRGRLDKESKRLYFEQLKKQKEQKLPLYIADIPHIIKPTDVAREIELFYHTHNYNPDVVVIDYANLMDSDRKYAGRSDKYDYIFQDLHIVARFYNVAIVTAAQERRKNNQQKKSEESENSVDDIGVSNYMATHCELVAHLQKDQLNEIENTLEVEFVKNRYGRSAFSTSLFAAWSYNYIGDRHLKLHGNLIS